jgi:hypothetical protein
MLLVDTFQDYTIASMSNSVSSICSSSCSQFTIACFLYPQTVASSTTTFITVGSRITISASSSGLSFKCGSSGSNQVISLSISSFLSTWGLLFATCTNSHAMVLCYAYAGSMPCTSSTSSLSLSIGSSSSFTLYPSAITGYMHSLQLFPTYISSGYLSYTQLNNILTLDGPSSLPFALKVNFP